MSGTYANYVTFNYILLYTLFYGKNGLFHVGSRILFPPTNSHYSFSELENEGKVLTDDPHPPDARGEGVAHQCEARSHEYPTVQAEVQLAMTGDFLKNRADCWKLNVVVV